MLKMYFREEGRETEKKEGRIEDWREEGAASCEADPH